MEIIMEKDLLTVFENKANHKWWLPTDFRGDSGEMCIKPGEKKEFLNANNGSVYARYERVELVSERDEEGSLRSRVVTHRRKTWTPPENRGLTLIIQNEEGDPRLSCSYKEGDFSIASPAGIEIEIYDVDPRLSVARYKKLVYTPQTFERLFDPRMTEGYRTVTKGGEFKGVLRDEEELRKLEEMRRIIFSHSIRAMQDIELKTLVKGG